jgi:hypothetical protein
MRRFIVLTLSSLIAFHCSNQSSKLPSADKLSAHKADGRQVKELIFDTVINQYIPLSNQESIKQKIDSLIFCKRPEIDFEKEYIVADTNAGEYLCL